MPILLSAVPAGISAATAATVHSVRDGLNNEQLRAADDSTLHLSLAHGVYNLGATDVEAGRGLAAAELTSWRHLIDVAGAPVATVEVNATEGSAGFLATAGPRASGLAAALAHAEALEQTSGTDYTLRVLRIPAFYAELLWLSAADASRDLLVPIQPSMPPIDPGTVYTPATVLALLQRTAADKDLDSTSLTS